MSEMSGLSIALSSLMSQQQALDVTGQNIANASTPGYTRQAANLTETAGPIGGPYSTAFTAGSGVSVTGIDRLNSNFLDMQDYLQNGVQSQLSTTQGTYSTIEQTFPEPSSTGIASQLSNYWSAWSTLSNSPDSTAARQSVITQGQSLASSLNQASGQLSSQWSTLSAQVGTQVTSINSLASQVANLNSQIRATSLGAANPNALMDQRDGLVMQLVQATGGTVSPGQDGVVNVNVGGTDIVSGVSAMQLQVSSSSPSSLAGVATSPVSLTWTGTSSAASVTGGTLGGLLSSLNTTIPTYSSQLDTVASSLATTVNAAQAAGYDLNGNAGVPFFTGTTASTITVSITDPSTLAASGQAPTTDPTTGALIPNYDGSNAAKLGESATSPSSPDATYNAMIVQLGVQSSAATNQLTVQQNITSNADQARNNQSGVSIDQEMTNMVMFQRAYQAAGRYMTAIDQNLQTLIQSTGMAGIN